MNTGKRHRNGLHGPHYFDTKAKIVAAMLHSGIGYTQFSEIFETLPVPTSSRKFMKKYEREIGLHFEEVLKTRSEQTIHAIKRIIDTRQNGNFCKL